MATLPTSVVPDTTAERFAPSGRATGYLARRERIKREFGRRAGRIRVLLLVVALLLPLLISAL